MSVAVQSIQSLPGLDYSPFDLNYGESQAQLGGNLTLEAASSPTRPWKIPASAWQSLRHPRSNEVSREVNAYFIQHWPFSDSKAERKFVNAGFPNVTCLYFPLAKDDRIHFACRLLTILFLIDDVLEDMSFADGQAYNEHLMPIMRGDQLPDRCVPVEYIMYDLWESMREHDKPLADEILEPTFTFMRSQTDRTRLQITELGQYFVYREGDVGKALLSALMRFSMAIELTPAMLASLTALEQNCSRQISVVNDIYSWEKELQASRTSHKEGSALCSAVKVLAESANLSVEASKRVLWSMVREWEEVHDQMCETMEREGLWGDQVSMYAKGLEYQMSGNEEWSRTTKRYSVVD